MSDDEPIKNPHDRFIRHFLAQIDQVRELVQWQLPADVLQELDLTSITPMKGTFVSRLLREHLSDLVFNVRLTQDDGEALVVLLFEHKSSPDEMTAFQVLRYIVEISHERQRNGHPLCCVIPIVLYHGPQPWNVARTVPELVRVPESLKPFVPQFSLSLIDLSQSSEDDLRQESLFLATMTLLKYILTDELPLRLPDVLRLYRQLLPPATALESLETVLRYIASGTDRISRDELTTIVIQTLKTQGESLMPTIAEQWRQEGVELGMEKGTKQGIAQGIEQGELIGQIRAFQTVLGQVPSQREELKNLSLQELTQMTKTLEDQIDQLNVRKMAD